MLKWSLAMSRTNIWTVVVFLLAGVVSAAEPKTTDVVLDQWEAAYLGKSRSGFVHTVTRIVMRDGKKYYRATSELNLTVTRFNDTATLRMETDGRGSNGKVTAVSMRQFSAKAWRRSWKGLSKSRMHIVVHDIRDGENGAAQQNQPWKEDVLGLHRQQSLYRTEGQAEAEFSYISYADADARGHHQVR